MRGLMILLAALVAVASAAAAAPAITTSRWETYTNTRYGVIIDYPADVFAVEPPPPDNAGRNFEAPSLKARFFVYTTANALDQSLAELEAEDIADLDDKDATKQNGADWYQVVGMKNDEVIARRVMLSEGGAMMHRLEIGFPADAAGAFAPIIERMIKSFRVDPTIPEKAAEMADQAAPAPAPAAPAATPSTPVAPPAAPQKQAGPAQPEPISGEGWRVQMPSRDYKDLPALISHRDITHGAELGNISFVCDRSRYYVLLVSPFFKYRLTQQGRVTLDDGSEYASSFRDLYGSRDPLGKKINWDADILYAEIPKTLLAKFAGAATLRVDLEERSWTIDLTGIGAQLQPFTTLCETGRPARSR